MDDAERLNRIARLAQILDAQDREAALLRLGLTDPPEDETEPADQEPQVDPEE